MNKNGLLVIGYTANKEKTIQDQIKERGYSIGSPFNRVNSMEDLDNLIKSIGFKKFYSKIISKKPSVEKLIYGATK